MAVKINRLYCDATGESYLDAYELDQELRDFAPPAAPISVSAEQAATGYTVLDLPVDWGGETPHPTPGRHMLFCLAGSIRVTASSGASCDIGVGDALLMTDTTGKGHATSVTSTDPVRVVMIKL